MSFSKILLSQSAFLHNAKVISNIKGKKKIIFPVKSNAYGHGLHQVVKMSHGIVDMYMTATLEEAIEIKRIAPFKDVFIDLPLLEGEELKEAIERGFIFNIVTACQLKLLSGLPYNLRRKARLQVEFDTGMNRTGFKHNDINLLNDFFLDHPEIKVEGVFTHYATGIEDKEALNKQYDIFKDILSKIRFYYASVHSENSAALLTFNFEDMHYVRPGITLYGMKPSPSYNIDLLPVLSWKSVVIDVKDVKKGEGVSYGPTFIAQRDMKIATVPVGYGDGYPRNLSNKGYVIIRDKRVKIIGTICMNHFMVDVSGIDNVKVGDEVVVIGNAKDESISAEEIAALSGTINYEITTRISPFLPRIVEK